MACTLKYENGFRRDGCGVVAGVDEAGRGPLAGPVSAAAVILPARFRLEYLDDSKKLTAKRRDVVYEALVGDVRVKWCSAIATVEEIGEINILRASWLAMERAVEGLGVEPGMLLVDGLPVKTLRWPQKALVGGDGISLSIAAASVIAKVERDRMMVEYAERYPEYGFEKHKGYGTKKHLEALRAHGPCAIHRKTFRPVAELAAEFGA